MSVKNIVGLSLMLISFGVHAIPPAPPASIFKKIKNKSETAKCITADNIALSDLIESEKVKFDLQLNSDESAGILTVIEDNLPTESFEVTCN